MPVLSSSFKFKIHSFRCYGNQDVNSYIGDSNFGQLVKISCLISTYHIMVSYTTLVNMVYKDIGPRLKDMCIENQGFLFLLSIF